MALGLFVLMAERLSRVEDAESLLLTLSAWVIVPHVLLGLWVFVRHLNATGPVHSALDILAFVFLCLGVVAVGSTAAWCVGFGLVFTVAILKYVLVARSGLPDRLQRYVRDKIRLESPAVGLFFLAAVAASFLPGDTMARSVIAALVLLSSLGFAVFMILIRRAYHPFFNA